MDFSQAIADAVKTAAERAEEVDDCLKTFMFVIPKVCCRPYQLFLTRSHYHLSQTITLVSLHVLPAGDTFKQHCPCGAEQTKVLCRMPHTWFLS